MADIKDMTTGVILAGGRGRRMDERDKGLVTFAGCRLIEHVIGALEPQVKTLVINANRNLEVYRAYGHPVISDRLSGFQGPLAGIESALAFAQTPYLATAPCDTPNPPCNLVERLGDALLKTGSDLAVADDGQRMHPVFCLMKTAVLDSLRAQLSDGERKIDRWFAKLKVERCDFSAQKEAFCNINTPQDLAEMQ